MYELNYKSNTGHYDIAMLNCSDVFYLLDPQDKAFFPLLSAHTIVASLPSELSLKRYLNAEGSQFYYVPKLTFDETKRIFKADTLGHIDKEVIKQRFYIVGGDIRGVASSNSFKW